MAEQPAIRLILASGSAGRRYLMTRAGYRFDVIPANIDEPTGEDCTDIRAFVHHVAWSKAAAVASRTDEGLILAADTVGWLDGHVIGKPEDEKDARRILKFMGGRVHALWTGVCLWRQPDGLQVAWQEVSRVEFKALSDAEIDSYLATRTWQGCSGAYAVKEEGDPYVRVVEGTVSNVIGLPMETLATVMRWLSAAPSL